MEIDSLQLPIDWEKVEIHKLANRVGKRWIDGNKLPNTLPGYGTLCQDCGRRATHCPKFKWCESEKSMRDRYGFYGPNCVIYLGFIKRIIIFMLICVILYCVPMFVLNLVGIVCKESDKNCKSQDVIYYWSVYNVLGDNPGSLPHHIIWFIFVITMCVFTLFLRKYSMQLYKYINNRNETDSDFCLILRRLPKNTKEQDILNLFQKQAALIYEQREEKSQKILEELKELKVKDIIMIFKFHQLMKVNDKNVKNFKKFMKGKQQIEAKQFKAEPLPEVTKFANAAIVRFYTNRGPELIMKTVSWNIIGKIIHYFFPFYHPHSQYKINENEISIEVAPEPTDIQWQNFGFSESLRVFRKILVTLFAVCLLIVSAAISIAISIAIEAVLNKTDHQPVYLTILLVIITLVYNTIVQIIISFAIKIIYLDTNTDQQCEQLSITVISQAINLGFFSIFAPIIAMLPSFIKLDSSDSSSFPLVMFTTILFQSFLGTTINFLLNYFAVIQTFFKYLHQKGLWIHTQTEALRTFKGSQVLFVNTYTHNVIIVWFSFLYGVVSPICVFIGMTGMFLKYYYEKILFNSKYSIPIYGGPRLNSTMIDLLDFLPLLIGLFNLFLYDTSRKQREFEGDRRIYGLVYAMIGIGAFHAVFPWKTVIQRFYNQKAPTTIVQFDRNKLQTTYEKSYPASKSGFDVLFNASEESSPVEVIEKRKINIKDYIGELQGQSLQTIVEDAKNYCCKPW